MSILAAAIVSVPLSTLSIVAGLVLPLVVGLVTKSQTSSRVKALTNAVGAAVLGGIGLLTLNNGTMELKPLLAATAITFVVSGAAHEHLWKPLGISEIVANYFPNTGLGRIDSSHFDFGPDTARILDVSAAAAAGRNPEDVLGVEDVVVDRNAPHGVNRELDDEGDDR